MFLRQLLWESKCSFKVWPSPFSVPPALPEFTTSAIVPSYWMDGIHAICLKKLEKSCHGASETRSFSSQFLIGQLLVIQVIWIYSYRAPIWFLSTFCTFCCVYIMAAWTQDISVVQTELEIRLFSKSPLLARAERHHQDSFENLCGVEVWTLTSFRLCWSFDYTPTRSLVFWGLFRDASWIDAMKFWKTEIYQAAQAEFHTICCRFCALSSEHKGPVVAGAGRGSAAGTSVPSLPQVSRPSFEVTPVQEIRSAHWELTTKKSQSLSSLCPQPLPTLKLIET